MKYIELYGGIGGFRRGIEQAGKDWECVWYCDNDKYATLVFNRNFNERYIPTDIRSVNVKDIPDHDLLCAGFPCQSFSLAGKRRGFDDTRGTLFFEIVKILREKRPKYLLLENVKGLLSHDKGRTFNTIVSLLGKTVNKQSFLHETEDCLNYDIFWTVLNSKKFGVPQSRPRVFIMGFREDIKVNSFSFPKGKNIDISLSDILEDEVDEKYYLSEKMQKQFWDYIKRNEYDFVESDVSECITSGYNRYSNLNDFVRRKGQLIFDVYNQQIRKDGIAGALKGKGVSKTSIGTAVFTKERKEFREHKTENEVPTLKERMGTGGGNVPLVARCLDANMFRGITPEHYFERGKRNIIFKDMDRLLLRCLTPIECECLQGFPDNWTEEGMDENGKVHKISDTQRYKTLGNAVTTKVIEAIMRKVAQAL